MADKMEPFNPEEVHITKKSVALDSILRRLGNNTIRLSPEFQRNEVWKTTQRCRLIESLMLSIPIPLFYVASNKDGCWDVVDGLQRLSTIKAFLVDKTLILQDLEFWTEYNGMTIDDLPPVILNRIYETEFTFVIIEPGTPEKVKYNIFNRINTGGTRLSPQEIRNALYNGEGTKFLKRLTVSENYLLATDKSLKDERMAAQETILRCLIYINYDTDAYEEKDTQSSFLNRNLDKLNLLDKTEFLQLENLFNVGMYRNYELFGHEAFRYVSTKRSPINKTLFEVWGAVLAKLDENTYSRLLNKTDKLNNLFSELCKSDKFYRAVSRDPWVKENVVYRFAEINRIILEAAND